MDINKQNLSITRLDLKLFQDIFEKYEPGVVIESLEGAPGSDRGDNYTATLYRILLKGHRSIDNDDTPVAWEKSVICKSLPDCKARRDAYRSEDLFRNEVEFYNKILPELLDFQQTKTKDVLTAIPKCYLAQNDLIILEDLRVRNFHMLNRKEGLTLDQITAVLKELAKYHSLSLAYKDLYPDKFTELKTLIKEGLFSDSNTEWYHNYYRQLTKSSIEMVSKTLSPDSHYVERLKNFVESNSFFSQMVSLVHTNSPLSVICHGDCWVNNFLYKHNEEGEIVDTCLVDFQLIRYSSLTLDLSNLIFCCTDKALRQTHLTSLLKLYHDELVISLRVLGSKPFADEDELWTQLQTEFKIFGKFGLGLAMDILPISTCSSEDAPDLYMMAIGHDHQIGAPELDVPPPNDICRQKMTDIVIDLVDAGML